MGTQILSACVRRWLPCERRAVRGSAAIKSHSIAAPIDVKVLVLDEPKLTQFIEHRDRSAPKQQMVLAAGSLAVDGWRATVHHEFYADPGRELLGMKFHSMTFFGFRQLAGQPCPSP